MNKLFHPLIFMFISPFTLTENCLAVIGGGYCLGNTVVEEIVITASAYDYFSDNPYLYSTASSLDYSVLDVNTSSTGYYASPEVLARAREIVQKCQDSVLTKSQCERDEKQTYNSNLTKCGSYNFTEYNGLGDFLIFQVFDSGTFYSVCKDQLDSQLDLGLTVCEVDYQQTVSACKAAGIQ